MIRRAQAGDLPAVAQIYEEILGEEDRRGASYTNWQRGKYPTLETARQAMEADTLWVLVEEDTVCGAVILNGVQLAEYAQIPWQFPATPEQVMVIHTLVISPRFGGRGLARELVAFCEAEARRQGKAVMRLDTYEGNAPANAMYPKLGYRFAGSARFLFQGFLDEVLNCYEKAL